MVRGFIGMARLRAAEVRIHYSRTLRAFFTDVPASRYLLKVAFSTFKSRLKAGMLKDWLLAMSL